MDQKQLDESERRRIQEELFQLEDQKDHAEERFQHLFENALVGLYRLRLEDGAILAVNNAAAQLLGYPDLDALFREGSAKKRFLGRAHSKFLKSLRKKGIVESFQAQASRTDGTVVWAELSAKTYPDRGYAEGVIKDVTEQKKAERIQRRAKKELEERVLERTAELERANERLNNEIEERREIEKALRESEDHLQTILDSVQAAIVVIEADSHVIVEANPAALQIIGASREQVVGHLCHSICSTAEGQCPITDLGMKLDNTEQALRAFDGRTVPVLKTVVPMMLNGRRHLLESFVDITERKLAEVALHQAKDAAESANRAKSEFLANMSHELRTPLNGVIGMTDLLMATSLNAKQQRYAQTAKTSADVLLNLINDILDLSKIEAGKLELETIEFDLWTTVEDVTDTMAYKAAEKGIELTGFVDPSIEPHLRGDPGRLRQILANLTSNAVKFTETGEVVVQAVPAEETDSHITVRFTVRDTGIGIPPDRMDRLFQSFSQVDTSTTRKYGGTGLGLRISQQLAELMGGRIGVESKKGKGSTFWFTARLQKLHRPTELARRRAMCDDLQGIRVLVVDDNRTNREILHQQLTAWGLHAETAADGPSALAMLRETVKTGVPFRMAILDMQMPGMDGEQLGKAIKEDRTLRDTILLMLTSLGNECDHARLKEIGFEACATKPVKQSQLLDTVLKAVANKDAWKGRRMSKAATDSQPPKPKQHRSNTRILLVEDNAINQEVAANILEMAGYQYDAVSNGKQAVDAVREKEYDLVLMDCQMPEMDGFEATRIIRQNEERGAFRDGSTSRIPIIALTANVLKGDRERCLAAGMDDYVGKPLNPENLVKTIDTQLSAPDTTSKPVENHPFPQASRTPADDSVSTPLTDSVEPSSPFDARSLTQRCLGSLEVVERVIRRFESEAGETLEQIQQSIDAGDAGETARLAHRFKGTSANLSAETLRVVSAHLEKVARAKDLNAARDCLTELRGELERCLKFIPELLTMVPSE